MSKHGPLQLVERDVPDPEVFSLERAAGAYERMLRGQARFRVVPATGN